MNIRKAKDNFDKDEKPKYFNYNVYRHIVKDCKKPNEILESATNANK